jgi:hypothetical protein
VCQRARLRAIAAATPGGRFRVNLRRLAAPALGPVVHGQRPASLETHFRRALGVAAVWGWPHNTKALRFVVRVYISRTISAPVLFWRLTNPKRTEYKRTTQNEPWVVAMFVRGYLTRVKQSPLITI